MDGAGKTTHINTLCAALREHGLRTRVLAFWDDVVVFSRYREGFVHRVYGSERGVGTPGRPVERRDKNVRRWYLTIARHLMYAADAIHLRRVLRRAAASQADVIIFDRYAYDQMANLPLRSRASQYFVRWLARFVPRPHLAFLLDADPGAAVARKPEYPLAFMHQCRTSYHELAGLLGSLTVIPPLPLEAAKKCVLQHAFHLISRWNAPGARSSTSAA
ncbi:MAG: thymidylate kinase [Acidobacteria bacterium]|nr:thymidylate kinase [Acidobacteriota bacterium]